MPRSRFVPALLVACLLLGACRSLAVPADGQSRAPAVAVETLVESRVAVLAGGENLVLHGVLLAEPATVREFYTRRAFAPAWTDPDTVAALVRAVRGSALEGLDPRDYHLDAILALQHEVAARRASPFARADAELLFTDALARLVRHYAFGKVDPAAHEQSWNIRAPDAGRDAAAVLAGVIGPDLATRVATELPQHPIYRSLRAELVRLQVLAARGGWPAVPDGPTLKPGMDDARIPALRARLAAGGDLPAGTDTTATRYDDTLLAAVQRFQARHGLKADGAVGQDTLEQLGVPVQSRIDTVRVNLDRARVLLRALPPRFVVVNIAGFHVYLVQDGQVVWHARAVVGQRYRETPLFRSEISYLQWNPTWTVPPGIIAKDILPPNDTPQVIARKKLKVIAPDGHLVNPRAVNWHAYRNSRGHIPYTLRQDPGPENALGRVKFMFPNDHQVYLHDTPSTGLFDEDERTFSSGCVRIEDPLTLARLLANDPAWDDARIASVIAGGQTENLVLRERVPVLLAYWTAWVEADGTLQFRRDIYGRDARWLAALDATP